MSAGGHILLVEDDEATRYAVGRILASAGLRITPAADGETALQLVARVHPDLVLLDVRLPDMSGFDVVRRLRADPATAVIPVVHLSAMSVSAAEQVRGLEGGADAYLTHPIEPRVLVATIDALLRAHRAERRYRKLFDTGLLGILSWDAAGTIVDANDAFLALVGHTREDVAAGRLRWDLLAPPVEGAGPPPTPLRPGGESRELLLARRDGSRFPALVGRARNGDGDDAVAFVLDLTGRRAAEEALREADRRKDEFLATLSHELRNPLAPIRNAIALLDQAPPSSAAAGRARDVLARQTAHLARLVDDLLDVTRIARGKVNLAVAPVDLGELAQRAAEDARSLFEAAHLTLRLSRPPEPLWVDGDATRLAQVTANLLQNAAKFTPAGGLVEVVVEAGDQAVLRVRDEGVGLSASDMAHLFEPFSQAAQGLARTQGGLGLGLALVRGLVDLHGGTVSARSAGVGRGAEFTVILPRRAAPPPAQPAPDRAAARCARVLLIEDNADAAETLADLLGLRGHQVWTAADGETGIARARALLPDLVLCDIGLPGVDGYRVAQALRADPALAPARLVALSGYARQEDRERSAAAGFDAHVAKPLALEVLEAIIAALPRR